MKTLKHILLLSAVFFIAGTSQTALAIDVPVNDGFVTDSAHLLSESEEQTLETNLQSYAASTSNEIAVLTVPSLSGANISDTAVTVMRTWGIGTKEKNNGLLLLISYDDRSVNITTGYGLEGAIPDIIAKGIIDKDLSPAFREGKYYAGLTDAVETIQKHIAGEYTADRYTVQDSSGIFPWIIFIVFIVFDWMVAIFSRSKSWWLGGIFGGVFGIILTVFFTWWISIPLLVAVGLLFDYIVSRGGPRGGGKTPRFGGGFGSGGGGGGFGGFGGGSTGGGGATGKW
jgi:uncharacterized protein